MNIALEKKQSREQRKLKGHQHRQLLASMTSELLELPPRRLVPEADIRPPRSEQFCIPQLY